jgi:hypothetical protein
VAIERFNGYDARAHRYRRSTRCSARDFCFKHVEKFIRAEECARARATRDVGFSLSQPGDSGISELAGIANQEPVHSSIWTKNAISQLLIPR